MSYLFISSSNTGMLKRNELECITQCFTKLKAWINPIGKIKQGYVIKKCQKKSILVIISNILLISQGRSSYLTFFFSTFFYFFLHNFLQVFCISSCYWTFLVSLYFHFYFLSLICFLVTFYI